MAREAGQDGSEGGTPPLPSLGLILATGNVLLLLGVVLLGALFVASLDRSGRQLAIAGNSQQQLLLATQIEGALAATSGGAPRDVMAARRLIAAYAASVRAEQAMSGAMPEEARDAARFHDLLGLIEHGQASAADHAALRALTAHVVAREQAEVEQVAAASFRLRYRAWRLALGLVGGLAGLLLLGSLWLYRTVAAQRRALEAMVRERTADLRERNRRLAEIDGSRRLFFSKISHELRTPVAVMRGEAEVAERSPDPDPATFAHIVANADFLQRRLDDLLALARSDEGRLTLAHAPLDLAGLAGEALAVAGPFARSSGVILRGSGLARPLMIEGDAIWLRQALLAAIDNGVKFAGTTPVALRLVRCHGAATIWLLDRGPGVAEEQLARIFDPYVQTEAGRARGGSGLGLSLARWVIEQHGGAIEARRRRGGGLAILMRLPGP